MRMLEISPDKITTGNWKDPVTVNLDHVTAFTSYGNGQTILFDVRGGTMTLDIPYEDFQSYFGTVTVLVLD